MQASDSDNPKSERRKEEELIAALLSQPTIAKAAKQAGISEATALRWMQEPDFCRQYREARRKVVETAVAALQQSLMVATATFVEIAGDKTKPASARIAAARSMYEFSLRAIELTDHEERLLAIEAALEANKENGKR
jgi:hypothetical protein